MPQDLSTLDKETVARPLPQVDQVDYTEQELLWRSNLIREIENGYELRRQNYAEFNDMTYEEYWEGNAKAANSYIPPKKNDQDVRVVTGTTEEKDVTLLSSLLNYNLEPDIEAYDKHDELIVGLGEVAEDLVRKSRRIELPSYDEKRVLIYKELLDQGTVFVEDAFIEMQLPRKKLKDLKWRENVSPMKIEWESRAAEINRYCNANLITGLNVYLGNIREFFMEYQPYIYTRRILTRSEAYAIYGTWERWKNVPYNIHYVNDAGDTRRLYNDWSLEEIDSYMVEEVKCQHKFSNSFMIMLNGVMMLPIGFPQEALNGRCEYTIAKGDLSPISRFFAYSKSIPAKTKVDQQVFDEMLKLIILKTRQSYEPPMANNTGQSLTRRIFDPGKLTPNVDVTKLSPILQGQTLGVTNAEFNAAQFVKGIIDEKSVSPVFQGNATKGQQTAREVVELKQQSQMKLGLAITGVVNLEKKLSWLRLFNVIWNWTTPIDKKPNELRSGLVDVYRKVTTDAEFEDGQKGKRIIEFASNAEIPETSEQVMAEEELLSQRQGGAPVRKVYLNPKQLRQLEAHWYIEITPTEKQTSELKSAMFGDSVREGYELFGGPAAFNQEYLKGRWAAYKGENAERMFNKMPTQQPALPGMPEMGGQSQLQEQMMPQAPQQPSLNTLVGI